MQLFRLFATGKAEWSEFRLTLGRGAFFLFSRRKERMGGASRRSTRVNTFYFEVCLCSRVGEISHPRFIYESFSHSYSAAIPRAASRACSRTDSGPRISASALHRSMLRM